DLVVTTRLHSSLFANGHGIPGIIINDTDRHTHALEGFPHSVWVNTRRGFAEAFARAQQEDLSQVAQAAREFKRALLQRYVDVLSGPMRVPVGQASSLPVHGASRPRVPVVDEESTGGKMPPEPAGWKPALRGVASDYQFNSEFKEQKLVRQRVG